MITISIGARTWRSSAPSEIREAGRVRGHRPGEHLEDRDRRLGVALVAGERARRSRPLAASAFGRRRRVVEDVLGPDDERLGVVAGREEPAGVGVEEQAEQVVGDAARVGEPRQVVELGEREQRLEQRGVVFGVGEVRRAPRAQEAAVGVAELARGGTLAFVRAASIQSSRSSAAAASVSAARNSAFQPSSTLSSRPGPHARAPGVRAAPAGARLTARARLVAFDDVQDAAAEAVCGSTKFPAAVTP